MFFSHKIELLFRNLSTAQRTMEATNEQVGYNNWNEVPRECHACESGIDSEHAHYVIVNNEECVHPGCILNTEICYGCFYNSENNSDHFDINGNYHKNCYCMSTR